MNTLKSSGFASKCTPMTEFGHCTHYTNSQRHSALHGMVGMVWPVCLLVPALFAYIQDCVLCIVCVLVVVFCVMCIPNRTERRLKPASQRHKQHQQEQQQQFNQHSRHKIH
ncbi:hypothetical protein GQX74_003061 [Glossina fuscipes]|uniref:Uncharacterized protein n=1 Tax=Glossina palpalis gambiensis TaxID=67801 RepID=A0A1B0AXU7_9MUSC|nr:hypothetical protein GQX74_003061 [Glossina fuscipes]